MASTRIDILFPTGRVVQGNLYTPQDKDADGKPLVVKSGPRQGQPTVKYYFAVAIPKQPGHTHWSQTEWGAKIWAHGHASWPAGQTKAPTFAWKVEDGDSTIPNKKGRTNAGREGFPGNWIVNFSSEFAVKIYNNNGTAPLFEKDYVKPGHFVQVFGSVDSNRSDMNPGLFVNHGMVAFQGFGPEIHTGADPTAVGFGAGPAPAGMSAAPIGAMTAPPAAPGAPAAPTPLPPAAPTPLAVVPAPAMIAPPAAPAAPVGPTMTAKAGGAPWSAFLAQGWDEARARTAGYIV